MTLRHTIEIRKSMRQMVGRDKTLSSSHISQFRIRLSRFTPLKATKETKNMEFCACVYHNFSRHNSVSVLAWVVCDTRKWTTYWCVPAEFARYACAKSMFLGFLIGFLLFRKPSREGHPVYYNVWSRHTLTYALQLCVYDKF